MSRRVAPRWALVAALPSLLGGCGRPRAQPPRTALAAPHPREVAPEGAESLAAQIAQIAREVRVAEAFGLRLQRADGALEITGERAPDEALTGANLVTHEGRSAAVLVTSNVGNVWVLGLRFEAGAWRGVAREALVGDGRPGARLETAATAEARAMLGPARRELIATASVESDDGADARDPRLWVLALAPDGQLQRLGEVPFGRRDPQSGAEVRGEWVVDETLARPRELYVQLSPGRRGPGGAAPPIILRQSYRIEGGRLELVEQSENIVRPRGAVLQQ